MPDRASTPGRRQAGPATVRSCQQYQHLLKNIGHCETLATEVAGDDRAIGLLSAVAARCRAVVAVFDRDLALHTYLESLPYCRAIDLLGELARQLPHLVRQAVHYSAPERAHPRLSSPEKLWAEAEALAGRAVQLATDDAAAHPPMLRLDTADGSRALSRRLISTYQLQQAAEALESAIAAAAALPHADPAVNELPAIAAQLRTRVAALDAERAEDWWAGYFDARPGHRLATRRRTRRAHPTERCLTQHGARAWPAGHRTAAGGAGRRGGAPGG